MWQLVLTLIFYIWLFAVLWFIWSMWHYSMTHTRRMEQALVEAAMKSAEAAQKAAEAAQTLALYLKREP